MITRGVLPVLLAVWAAIWVLSSPVAAQQADAPQKSEQAAEQDSTAPDGSQDSPGNDPAPAKTDDSPFDYQSSEEISEDLSVSFPVDI